MIDAANIFAVAMLLAIAGVIAWCVWAMICNERTYRARTAIISACRIREDWSAYDQVGYEEHMRCLMWLQSPRDLYGHDLWDAAFPTPPENEV